MKFEGGYSRENREEYREKRKITETLEVVLPENSEFDKNDKLKEYEKNAILNGIIYVSKNYNTQIPLKAIIIEKPYNEIVRNVSDLDANEKENNRFYVNRKVLGEAQFMYGITTDKGNDSVIELDNFKRIEKKLLKKYLTVFIKNGKKPGDINREALKKEIENIMENMIFIIASHERGHQLNLVKRESNAVNNTRSIEDSHCKCEKGACLMKQVMNDEDLIDLTLKLSEKSKNDYLCEDCKLELEEEKS